MENPVVALSRVLAATRVTQRIARDLYDRNLPDLTAVYFEGTDEVGHVFASYTPPRPPCSAVRDEDVARYERVVAAYYGVVDRILGQWMRRAEEDGAALVVTSDHGFKWGDDRPCGFASGNWSTAAFWHRPEGVFAAWGRGVPAGRARARGRRSRSSTSRRRSSGSSACRPIRECRALPSAPRFPGWRRRRAPPRRRSSSCAVWRRPRPRPRNRASTRRSCSRSDTCRPARRSLSRPRAERRPG